MSPCVVDKLYSLKPNSQSSQSYREMKLKTSIVGLDELCCYLFVNSPDIYRKDKELKNHVRYGAVNIVHQFKSENAIYASWIIAKGWCTWHGNVAQ